MEAFGGPAVVLATTDHARLVHETWAGDGRRLRSIALGGDAVSDLGSVPEGLGLHGPAVDPTTAMRLPPGWILLAPDGRLPAERADRPLGAPPRPGRR